MDVSSLAAAESLSEQDIAQRTGMMLPFPLWVMVTLTPSSSVKLSFNTRNCRGSNQACDPPPLNEATRRFEGGSEENSGGTMQDWLFEKSPRSGRLVLCP
eukprot:2516729-Rhodomonas_salina.1